MRPRVIPHRLGAARHPTIDAVGTAQAIPHGEVLAGDEAAIERVPKLRCIVRMDGLDDRLQSAHSRLVCIRYVQAEEIDHALVEESRLPVRSQAPQVARNHVDELRELMLPVAQRLLDRLLIFDFYRHNRLLLPDKANLGTV